MARLADGEGARRGGLGRQAAGGVAATVVGQGGRIAIQLVSVVLLARLLSPNDYGLFAMVMSVAGIAEVFRDFGLTQAVVQARTFTKEQRNTLFWVNSLIGLVLSSVVFFGASAVAAFYRHPELVPLAQGVSGVFFLNGLSTQFRAGLNRDLRFRALAVLDFGSTLLGFLVAVALAVWGFGVWALVIQVLVQSFVLLLASAAYSRWLPGLPSRNTPIRSFLRFGTHMVGTQVITYIGGNADRVIIGLFLGASPLGLYTRPYQLVMNIANQLRSPITNVAIPVLSRLQDSPRRYWEFTRIGQTALGYSIVAAFGFAVGASKPLTLLLLGSQWLDAAPVMSLLSAAAALQTLGYFGYWVYVSKGITAALFKYNLLSVSIKIICLLVGARWGVSGVAAGYLIATAIAWPLSLIWINKSISGVPIRRLALNFVRMATLGAVGAGAAFALSELTVQAGPWVSSAAALAGALTIYAASVAIPSVRRDVRDLWSLRHYFKR